MPRALRATLGAARAIQPEVEGLTYFSRIGVVFTLYMNYFNVKYL